jgi:adenylate kinase
VAGADSRRSRRIVFLGPPNSGKGTQAARLAREIAVPAISTGDMLRDAVASGSELGQRVEAVMESGMLVDDPTMAEVVRDRLARYDTADGFLLDGYPRTFPQAETLRQILDERGEELDGVFLIDAPTEVLVERALSRGRTDDREEVIRERLEVYRRQTEPLVAVYDEAGVLRRIDGNQTIEEVGRQIRAAAGIC